jgi:hypothetical protein
MLARRSLGEGGSIVRRPSPGRNRRRARRAAAAFHVVEILTPPAQEPATDFNAMAQGRKAAKQITNSQCPGICAFWTQPFLLCSAIPKSRAIKTRFLPQRNAKSTRTGAYILQFL